MRLLLVRHGQTPSNVTGALDTAFPGAGLTGLGVRQAEAIPAALADEQVSAVVVSPLVRTGLTAAPMAAHLGLEARTQPGLEEIAAGRWEMSRTVEAVAAYRSALAAWARGDLAYALPGAPDGADFLARFDDGLRSALSALADDATVMVVSHGAAIRTWTSIRTGVPLLRGMSMPNTGMAIVEGDPDAGWSLREYVSRPIGGIHLDGGHAHDSSIHTGG